MWILWNIFELRLESASKSKDKMDFDSWTSRFSAASQRYQSRSDLYLGGDDIGGDDESRPEFLCPFCAADFDFVGLCCHMDEEHVVEARSGACPVCAKTVGMDLVGHITVQHGSLLKVQRRRRFRKCGSNSTYSLLRKELREENLRSLLERSEHLISSSNAEPDPALSSFMYKLPVVDELVSIKPHSKMESSSMKESSSEDSSQRNIQQSPLSDKDQEERARRCKFVRELLLSTFLDDLSQRDS